MGTRFDLLFFCSDASRADALWEDVACELERLDAMLDRFDPSSEVSRINAAAYGAPVAVSAGMDEILSLCRFYYEATEHLFDITLKEFSRVVFSAPRRVGFGDAGLSLDLGGFAKGYALRAVGAMLRRAGVESAFVDFGGSSILGVGGHPYGPCWKVSLPDPATRRPLDEFGLRDRALSTSGNTPHHTEHIVNPLTGRYESGRKLAAVVCEDPLDAEVLSTVRMIADERQWRRIAANFKPIQATLYTL